MVVRSYPDPTCLGCSGNHLTELCPDKPDRRLTRVDVARILQVHTSTVCAFEKKGLLHPEMHEGRWFHSEAEVLALQHKRPRKRVFVRKDFAASQLREREAMGRRSAEVFELLNQGKGLREIVIEAKIDPDLALALYKIWKHETFDTLERARAIDMAEKEAERRARKLERQDFELMRLMRGPKAPRDRKDG